MYLEVYNQFVKDYGVKTAILLAYLIRKKTWVNGAKQGWVRITLNEIYEHTALSKRAYYDGIKRLKDEGLIETHREGRPPRVYYRFTDKMTIKKTGQRNGKNFIRYYINIARETDIECAVLFGYLLHWNSEKGVYRRYSEIQEDLGFSEWDIKTCLKKLKEAGYIARQGEAMVILIFPDDVLKGENGKIKKQISGNNDLLSLGKLMVNSGKFDGEFGKINVEFGKVNGENGKINGEFGKIKITEKEKILLKFNEFSAKFLQKCVLYYNTKYNTEYSTKYNTTSTILNTGAGETSLTNQIYTTTLANIYNTNAYSFNPEHIWTYIRSISQKLTELKIERLELINYTIPHPTRRGGAVRLRDLFRQSIDEFHLRELSPTETNAILFIALSLKMGWISLEQFNDAFIKWLEGKVLSIERFIEILFPESSLHWQKFKTVLEKYNAFAQKHGLKKYEMVLSDEKTRNAFEEFRAMCVWDSRLYNYFDKILEKLERTWVFAVRKNEIDLEFIVRNYQNIMKYKDVSDKFVKMIERMLSYVSREDDKYYYIDDVEKAKEFFRMYLSALRFDPDWVQIEWEYNEAGKYARFSKEILNPIWLVKILKQNRIKL